MRGAILLLCISAGARGAELPVAEWNLAVEGRDLGRVQLPADLGALVGRAPVFVLWTEIELPAELQRGPLTLTVNNLNANGRVEADGIEASPLGDEPFANAPPKGWRLWRSDGQARIRLRLELFSSNYTSPQIRAAPVLSNDPAGAPGYRLLRQVFLSTALASGAVLVVLICLYGAALISERRREHVAFLVMASALLVAPLNDLAFLRPLFGEQRFRVMAFCCCIAELASVDFLHASFRLGRVPRVFRLGILVAAATTLFFGDDPYRGNQRAMLFLVVSIMIPCTVYNFVRLGGIVRRPKPDQDRFSAGLLFAVWLLAVIIAPLQTLTLAGRNSLSPEASLITLVIGLSLAVVLGRDRGLRLREVQRLNDELRRQIADRSGQLVAALGRLKPTSTIGPGSIIEDRYRVIDRLGAGGMGTVYRVERIADKRPLALKVLSGIADADALARFAREAQIAAQLDHPNVIAVLDVDVSRSGTLFLVMELVAGSSLAEKKTLYGDLRWALPILRQIAAALEALHARGIVHRDLKPANVLLDGEIVKVADFGLASLTPPLAEGDSTLTQGLTRTGAFMGTPQYMAPELARGAREATSAADIFSFGVLAHQLLTGKLPFASPPVLARLEGRADPEVALLSQLRPELGAVAALVDRCLGPAAARPSARELDFK